MSRTEAVKPAVRATDAVSSAPTDWWLASWNQCIEGQRYWATTLLSSYEALGAAQRDAWDQWVSRWAGGVPIDA
jgi:hypothetical protein